MLSAGYYKTAGDQALVPKDFTLSIEVGHTTSPISSIRVHINRLVHESGLSQFY